MVNCDRCKCMGRVVTTLIVTHHMIMVYHLVMLLTTVTIAIVGQ